MQNSPIALVSKAVISHVVPGNGSQWILHGIPEVVLDDGVPGMS